MSGILPKLLVLGGPDSGKSTYRAQLYQRIEHLDGQLRLVKSVGDTSALDADVGRLVQGLQPLHTHLDIYHSTTFVVENQSRQQFSIEFADYGGEQIRRIGESNSVTSNWIDRARHSTGWLFFLRIDHMRSTKSFMTEPVETRPNSGTNNDLPATDQNPELNAIETLQRLLFVRGASLRHRLRSPRLAILLSCWDELAETEREQSLESVLQRRAPLFCQFVFSNWEPEQVKMWGLSSTERKLPEATPDIEFARKGPQHMGYVVLNQTDSSPDLTIPVGWLMEVP